jgi:hypothetical protein
MVGMPYWDSHALEQGLALIDRVVRDVPLFEVSYEPNVESAEWFLRALENEGVIDV